MFDFQFVITVFTCLCIILNFVSFVLVRISLYGSIRYAYLFGYITDYKARVFHGNNWL